MKISLLLLILFSSLFSDAQKKIKSSIVLSSGEILKIDDVVTVKNGTLQDSSYQYVETINGFKAPQKCKGYEQRIDYFRYIDNVYYLYTTGFKIDIERALNSGEIAIKGLTNKASTPTTQEPLKKETEKDNVIFNPESIYLSKIKNVRRYPISELTQLDLKHSYSLEELKNTPDLLCITNTRYCLRKYHSIRKMGRYFLLSGLVLGTGSGFINNSTAQLVGLGIGGGLGLTGTILYLIAEKWLKYSTVKPILENDKVGLIVTF